MRHIRSHEEKTGGFYESFHRATVPSYRRAFVPSFLRAFLPSYIRAFVAYIDCISGHPLKKF